MAEMNETVKSIALWLGGMGRIRAMVGTTSFVYSNEKNFLMFDFKMCKKANKVKITYNAGLDLYKVEFFKIWGIKVKEVSSYEEVYGEDLKRFFEEETGLRLSL
jgi:hypothetical protein